MPIMNEYNFKSSNGKNDIYVREWLPDDTPVGIVQICHGMAEHIVRYDDFAKFLASKGYVVAGNDYLGHGKSISNDEELGVFGENGGWELIVGDVRKLQERLIERYPRLPVFIFGHSMGSFVARTYIIRYHDGPTGVILSGTGQQAQMMVSAGLTLAKSHVRRNGHAVKSDFINKIAFGSYNNKIKNNKTDWDWLSTDEQVVQNYIDDPYCGFVPTGGFFRDMFSGIKFISGKRNIERVNKDMPVFLIAGTADPVGDYGKGVMKAYQAYLDAGLSDVSLKLYSGARHELVNDFCKDDVYKDVLDWIQKRS